MTFARGRSNRSAMRDRDHLLKSAAIRARERRERVTAAGLSTGGIGNRLTEGREPFSKSANKNGSRPPIAIRLKPDTIRRATCDRARVRRVGRTLR